VQDQVGKQETLASGLHLLQVKAKFMATIMDRMSRRKAVEWKAIDVSGLVGADCGF
jgi:hypothetical protein